VVGELTLFVAEEGAGAERLDTLSGFLRVHRLRLEAEDVTPLRAGAAPPGTRAFELIAVSGLLVTLGHFADGLRSVVTALRGWLTRGGTAGLAVWLGLDGDVLEISAASAVDQDRLVELLTGRHMAGA
jgi:hypothetical protein